MIGSILRTIFDNLRYFRALFGYGLLVQLAFVAVLTPLSSYLLKYFVSLSGYTTISNKAIAEFVFSPWGLLAIWSIFGLVVAFFLAEQAGMQIIVAAKQNSPTIRFRHCLFLLVRNVPALLRLGMYQFLVLFLWAIPFVLLAGLTYWIFMSRYDINYYLEQQPTEYWIAVSIGILLAVVYAIIAFRLIIRWLFCIPLIVFEKTNVRKSIAQSKEKAGRRKFQIMSIVLVWIVTNLLISVGYGASMEIVNNSVLKFWSGHDNIAIIVTAALLLAEFLLGLALNLFFLAGLAGIAIRLFRELDGNIDAATLERLTGSEIDQQKKMRIAGISTTWAGVIVLLGATAFFSIQIINSVKLNDDVAITAHRAGPWDGPENTIAALNNVIEMGCEYAEIDVQETADGEVIVLHDVDTKRVAGTSKNVWESTFAELRSKDIGLPFSEKYRGERIPTLREMIKAAKDKIKLNIELKPHQRTPGLTKKVVQIIEEESFEDQCVLSSLDKSALLEAKKLNPKLVIGLNIAVSIGNDSYLDFDFLGLNHKQLNHSTVARFHGRGKQVYAWTVNDGPRLTQVMNMGVDNVLTDDPKTALRLRGELQEMDRSERLLLVLRDWLAN